MPCGSVNKYLPPLSRACRHPLDLTYPSNRGEKNLQSRIERGFGWMSSPGDFLGKRKTGDPTFCPRKYLASSKPYRKKKSTNLINSCSLCKRIPLLPDPHPHPPIPPLAAHLFFLSLNDPPIYLFNLLLECDIACPQFF